MNGWPTFCAYNLGYYYGFCWDADNHSNQARPPRCWTTTRLGPEVSTLKFGGRIRLEQNNVRELQQAQGSHTFLGDWTANTANDNNDPGPFAVYGDGLASLLLGLPTILTNQYNRGYFYFRQKEFGLYVNDSWKVSPV